MKTEVVFNPGLRFNITSRDAEQMREQSAFWSYEHRQYGRGMFRGEIMAYHTKSLQLTLAHRSIGFFARGGLPVGTTIISFPLINHQAIHYRGAIMKNCQALALKQNEEFEVYATLPTSFLTIAADSSLLARQTMSIMGKSFEAVRNDDCLTMNRVDYGWRMNKLTRLLKSLSTDTRTPNEAKNKEIETEILETVLLGTELPEVIGEPADRLYRAKKAEQYIRNNLTSPITIDTLCQYAGTTKRTLHLGFKQRFGVTPKAYLRIMRLNKVHRELSGSDARKSIAYIAMNAGFSQLGHFTEQYHRMFGETPTKTREQASLAI